MFEAEPGGMRLNGRDNKKQKYKYEVTTFSKRSKTIQTSIKVVNSRKAAMAMAIGAHIWHDEDIGFGHLYDETRYKIMSCIKLGPA